MLVSFVREDNRLGLRGELRRGKERDFRLLKLPVAADRSARTLVVRMGLHNLDITKPRLKVERVLADLKAFIRARERDPIFNHETGYIWSLEQGKDRGFHLHATLFFNGAHHSRDTHKARKIGELWVRIAQGQGHYFSCNADQTGYRDLGIGMINRLNSQACTNLVSAMTYLAKNRRHLRLKPVHRRTFGAGL